MGPVSEHPTQSASSAPTPVDDFTFGTTPNILTLIRMGFVPLVIWALYQRTETWDLIAALIFALAAITDWFDGYIARTQQLVTIYGKLLDPLADKFRVVSSMVMLQELHRIPPVVVMLVICRELAITGLRALASAEGVIIPASNSAKWKTATQMVAIPLLMVKQGLWILPLYTVGQILLYFSLAVSLWSAKDYIIDFFRAARITRKKRLEAKKLRKSRKKNGAG